ncbi:MAG: 30S ribosome-binding factor RbfA [Phycisphaeraceae bacterium]|nr:30S ribosome-binding factor RbfA [Phycisphaeraceae bacterium]
MSTRNDRLTSSIERGVQQVLARGLQDPRVRGLITVTKVELTPDGKQATIGISVLPAEHQKLTVHGLSSASRHIRREVGELIRTRSMPEFRFVEDGSLKKQAEVLGTLAKVREELEGKPAADGTDGDASEDAT